MSVSPSFAVRMDNALQYVPLASSASSVVTIFYKIFSKNPTPHSFANYMVNKSNFRVAVALVPVLGNLALAVADLAKIIFGTKTSAVSKTIPPSLVEEHHLLETIQLLNGIIVNEGHLETEGLFRESASKKTIEELKSKWRLGSLRKEDFNNDAILICHFMKSLIKKIYPEGMIKFSEKELPNENFLPLALLNKKLSNLSQEARDTFNCFIDTMYAVAFRSEKNKMTFGNLATSTSGILVGFDGSPELEVIYIERLNSLVALMYEYYRC